MIRLRTLGALDLQGSNGQDVGSILTRPKRVALLAYLALATPRGFHRRDRLIALFWPEHDAEHARNSLSQSVHVLRRALGAGAIVSRNGDALSVEWTDLWCDVVAFEEALDAGRTADAVELFRGDLLEGFHLTDTPEFERWVEGERSRLAARFAQALEALADEREKRGDLAGSASWWRRLAARDPYSSRVALGLMRALAAAGDPAAALQHARVHETLLGEELGIPAAPEVAVFVRRLRSSGSISQVHRRLATTEAGTGDRRPIESARATPARQAGHDAAPHRSLTADQLCARARQAFYCTTPEGFANGFRYAERAIELDSRHAAAHVTLGGLYIITSQADPTGDPRSRGVVYCQRAWELDPGLAEAPLWLAWAAQLDERFDDAEALALRGLELDPDGLFSHTALGWSRLNCGLIRGRWDDCVKSVASLARALQIHPRDTHTVMALSALYTLAGQYAAAQPLLERAAEVERVGATDLRLIGALTLLGHLHLHSGHLGKARAFFTRAITDYAPAPQVFAPYVHALTLCGLGDVERFEGQYDESVIQYSGAREMLDRVPGLIGSGYIVVRVETRLACAFRRLRMRREEARHAEAARATAAARGPYSFNWCWGASPAELHYDWAVYHATCADEGAMLGSLRSAVAYGWRERSLIDIDPAFAPYRRSASIEEFLGSIGAEPLPEVGSCGVGAGVVATSLNEPKSVVASVS